MGINLKFISQSRPAKDEAEPKAKTKNVKNAICVAVDANNSKFDMYSINSFEKSTIEHSKKSYTARLYSPEFIEELAVFVRDLAAGKGSFDDTFITLLLPNSAVSMNCINIPNMNRRKNEGALEAVVSGFYKNRNELRIKSYIGNQNKQITTYSLAVANANLLKSLSAAMSEAGMAVDAITFASNALCNSASALCPETKAESYLLLDIKKNRSRFVFAVKGRTIGFYELPFGYTALAKNKLSSEDMLFDHSIAELAVLNAREKAKAKQLTIMREENVDENSTEDQKLDAMFGGDENSTLDPTAAITAQTFKSLPKKEPRKLPKFMLRPLPHDEEGYVCENFRIFVKWALNLIQSNDKILQQGAPEKVYVNMPEDFGFIFEKINEEAEENGIEFASLNLKGEKEEITENLELFGALYANQYNKMNNF